MQHYDPDRVCPKCGGSQVWSEYRPYWEYGAGIRGPRQPSENAPGEEHIRRDCSRCKYWWYEKPSTRHLKRAGTLAAAVGTPLRAKPLPIDDGLDADITTSRTET